MMLPQRSFLLIRHGETTANRDHIIAGRTEAMLTAKGQGAAAQLALWSWPCHLALYASPQQRARDTAALAFPGQTARIVPGLRERDWGKYEGAPVAMLPPRAATPEGGEGWDQMLTRVAAAVTVALENAGGDLPVLVAHSGVIRAVRYLTGGAWDGPRPANTTPILFAPVQGGWRECTVTEKDFAWIA